MPNNDNERFINEPTTDNDNESFKGVRDRHARAETDAFFIMDKLKVNGDEYRKFYLKVVYHLPENVWREILTTASDKGNNPAKLFSFLAKQELLKKDPSNGETKADTSY